jgi:hypothetical protein
MLFFIGSEGFALVVAGRVKERRLAENFSRKSFGAYATKTNVPEQGFWRRLIYKGIFGSIAYDAFLTCLSRTYAGFFLKPLMRDDGAKLIRPVNLFNDTGWLNSEVKRFVPAHPGNDNAAQDDRVEPFAHRH